MKYIESKNELAIKKVFGQNPELCKSLINAFLPGKEGWRAESVRIIDGKELDVFPVFRNPSIVAECTDAAGKLFRVLFQVMWTDGFLQSVLLDGTKAYIRYEKTGAVPELNIPVIGIALVNYIFNYEKESYYHYFPEVEEAQTNNLLQGLHYVFIELPKLETRKNEPDDKQNRWLDYFRFVNEQTDSLPETLANDSEIVGAANLCRFNAYSDTDIIAYNRYKSDVEVKLGISNKAEERGFRHGVEKGMELGIEKGFERGYQKGSVAGVRRTALKALQAGISPEQVMVFTELNQVTVDTLVNLIGEYGAGAEKHMGD